MPLTLNLLLVVLVAGQTLAYSQNANSSGCSCINPFTNSAQDYIGEPEFLCMQLQWCFVSCLSTCGDKKELSGILVGKCKSASACSAVLKPRTEPYPGQRCSGRNFQGRRCCTPENPCNEGEGDCDGPGDGGGHDGHAGCKGDLVCGSNNCKKFGLYYHDKDDCCEKPSTKIQKEAILFLATLDTPLEPLPGQRCAGRNYQGRRCCTPENPCNEGEGDCDGPGDGGAHDGHAGCKGSLVCGSNNCKKFGAYYHEKDDCCEKA